MANLGVEVDIFRIPLGVEAMIRPVESSATYSEGILSGIGWPFAGGSHGNIELGRVTRSC